MTPEMKKTYDIKNKDYSWLRKFQADLSYYRNFIHNSRQHIANNRKYIDNIFFVKLVKNSK